MLCFQEKVLQLATGSAHWTSAWAFVGRTWLHKEATVKWEVQNSSLLFRVVQHRINATPTVSWIDWFRLNCSSVTIPDPKQNKERDVDVCWTGGGKRISWIRVSGELCDLTSGGGGGGEPKKSLVTPSMGCSNTKHLLCTVGSPRSLGADKRLCYFCFVSTQLKDSVQNGFGGLSWSFVRGHWFCVFLCFSTSGTSLYNTLGVAKNCAQDDIKKAYRKVLTCRHHWHSFSQERSILRQAEMKQNAWFTSERVRYWWTVALQKGAYSQRGHGGKPKVLFKWKGTNVLNGFTPSRVVNEREKGCSLKICNCWCCPHCTAHFSCVGVVCFEMWKKKKIDQTTNESLVKQLSKLWKEHLTEHVQLLWRLM